MEKASFAIPTEFPYISRMENRFDPTKDAANQEKHGLSLAFGDRLFEDNDHLILPSPRPEDGEERFKAIGLWKKDCLPLCLSGVAISLASFR